MLRPYRPASPRPLPGADHASAGAHRPAGPRVARQATPAAATLGRRLSGLMLAALAGCTLPATAPPGVAEPAAGPAASSLPASLAADPAAPAAKIDLAMLQLAQRGGCTACHQVDRPPEPDAADSSVPAPRPPVGPFWRDVANRYRGERGALAQLSATVTGGSQPLRPHWRDVAGLAMPANRALLSPAEVQRLLAWILALPEEPPEDTAPL